MVERIVSQRLSKINTFQIITIFVFQWNAMRTVFIKIYKTFERLLNRWSTVWAIALFAFALAQFGYIELIDTKPQSTHLWRQSDCASLALNYYQEGMRFFHPQVHNLHADGETSGYAISEFPVLYYVVAMLYKVFGPHYWVFRGVWVVLLFLGFFALFRFFHLFMGSKRFAFLFAFLIFTSPLLIFYGNNFLPDVPALVFTLTGWMFFAKWLQSNKYKHLVLVAFFFMLSGLLKVSGLISFFALAGIWFLELFGLKLRDVRTRVFNDRLKSFVPFAIALVLIVGWYVWAWYYNSLHSTKYFSMRTCPIWHIASCCNCNLGDIFSTIVNVRIPDIFGKPALYAFLLGIALLPFYFRHLNRLLLSLSLLMFCGALAYMALWFSAFYMHGYYLITLYPFLVFVVLLVYDATSRRFVKFWRSPFPLFMLILLAGYSVFYTASKQNVRYSGWMNDYQNRFSEIDKLSQSMNELGIPRSERIVSISDDTFNYTLNMVNRRGWTSFYLQTDNSLKLARHIANGAKFLFVSDFTNTIQEQPFLGSFMSNPIGIFNRLHVFRLDTVKHPFRLSQITDTLLFLHCNAEQIDPNNNDKLLSNNIDYSCTGAMYLNTSQSFSGNQSVMLSSIQPYGFTTRIPVGIDETVTVRVKRLSSSGFGSIVVSGSSGLYLKEDRGSVISGSDWELASLTVDGAGSKGNDYVTVYVWNSNDEEAFFDDFEVVVEKIDFRITPNSTPCASASSHLSE